MNKNITLTELARSNEIYIDSTAIQSNGFQELMIQNARFLKDEGNAIKLHRVLLNEFEKPKENNNIKERQFIEDRLNMLKALEEGGVIQYIGNSLESRCVEQLYLDLIVTHRNKKNLTVISNNYDLVHDVLLMNQLISFSGKEVTTFRITDEGGLVQVSTQGISKHSDNLITATEDTTLQTSKLLKMFGL